MRAEKAVQLAVLAATGVWLCELPGCQAATELKLKLCGRKLSDFMSRVCQAYNSPHWENSSDGEQSGAVVRRKRQVGIADACCRAACTWEQLTDFCAAGAHSEPPYDELEGHLIEDRSAERQVAPGANMPPRFIVGGASSGSAKGLKAARGEVGRGRNRGYGQSTGRLVRRCLCKRTGRARRRHASLMGNTDRVRVVARAAPIVGTVSPLLGWGRTLHTDLSPDTQQYAYVALYASPHRG